VSAVDDPRIPAQVLRGMPARSRILLTWLHRIDAPITRESIA
jgi:hypothetical protein